MPPKRKIPAAGGKKPLTARRPQPEPEPEPEPEPATPPPTLRQPQRARRSPSPVPDELAELSAPKLVGLLERRAIGRSGRLQEDSGTLVEWALDGDAADGPIRDERGEQLVKALASRLRREGRRFEDEYFPPSDESLFQFGPPAAAAASAAVKQEPGAARAPRRDHERFAHAASGEPLQIVWERSAAIAARQELAAVPFSQDIDPDDIGQGSLGDCYFLAAVASCAVSENDWLVKDLIVEEGWDVGLIGVKFFVRGRWATVIVDDFFPLAPWQGQAGADHRVPGELAPLFASSKSHARQAADEMEFWPMIMEKAFAKLHGSWEAIGANGGTPEDALNYLTGAPATALIGGGSDAAWEQLKDLIRDPEDVDERQGFVSASLRRDLSREVIDGTGLVAGHAYSVLACLEDDPEPGQILRDGSEAKGRGRAAERVRLVCVRNPWGEGEWKGAYHDQDQERWTERLVEKAREANPDAEVLGRTSSASLDGSFWMEWEDLNSFLELGACNPFTLAYPLVEAGGDDGAVDVARVLSYRGEWRASDGTAGGCTAGLFRFNPRLRITSSAAECSVHMTLTLPDLRYLLPDEGASPELWQRYGLRYPSVCVLRHVKVRACALPLIIVEPCATAGLLGQRSGLGVRHADLPTDTAGFFDASEHGYSNRERCPLILCNARQASCVLKLEPDGGSDWASCAELLVVNELRGAEGEFWLTLHASEGELAVETLPTPRPSARAADAMARDISRDEEEAEVGAELLAVLTREQRRLRAGAPLPETATPLGAMAADYDGGPEDDEIAMELAPPPPLLSPAVSGALCYASACILLGAAVGALPRIVAQDQTGRVQEWAQALIPQDLPSRARVLGRQAAEAGAVCAAATAAAAATATATAATACKECWDAVESARGAAAALAPGSGASALATRVEAAEAKLAARK